jgi:HAD superfamily hydrolase (TIGR01509 family)
LTRKNGHGTSPGAVPQDGAFLSSRFEHLRVILFDLDGTLRHSRPSYNEVLWDFAARYEIGVELAQRHQSARWVHAYWARSAELLEDVEAYPVDEEFWANFLRRHLLALGCPTERAPALALQAQAHLTATHVPQNLVDPGAPQALRALQAAGFRLGLLSNRRTPCHDELRELGLDSFFELVLVAGEVDAWKPEARLFHAALERMDAAPEHSLYVGDNYYADIVGARDAGLHPVLVDPDGLFPEAGCPVVSDMAGLQDLLLAPPSVNQTARSVS